VWKRKRVWVPLLIVVLLVAGLVVWAPWVAPAVPGNVRATSTSATSVRVDWDSSAGHTGAGKYAVLRDGQSVGEVGGDQTTFTDQGLRPGQSYRYSVKAKSWLSESTATPDTKVRVLAPSPAKPASGGVSSNAVVLTWAAPANSPAPDTYQVIRDGDPVQTLDAKATTYRDAGLGPATAYRYQVVAKWGDNASDPSEQVTVKTATPPLTAARLTGSSHEVHLRVTGVSEITNLPRGTSWTELWDLTPTCAKGACNVRLAGELSPPGFRPGSFNTTLVRRGTLYTGSATARLSDCGSIQATDSITIRLTVRTAKADGLNWVASSWSGTVIVHSPFVDAGGGSFCPAGRIDNAVAG
jgi:chitodextrinase